MQENKSRGKSHMQNRAAVERKMALAQYIRRESQDNRMKIRQRERILYGNESAPLWEKGRYGQGADGLRDERNPYERASETGSGPVSTFRFRMVIALLLFVAFLVCDTNGSRIGKYNTDAIHEMIVADSFHLMDEGQKGIGNDAASGLAQLFDFGR